MNFLFSLSLPLPNSLLSSSRPLSSSNLLCLSTCLSVLGGVLEIEPMGSHMLSVDSTNLRPPAKNSDS